jgi:hypothetical protein
MENGKMENVDGKNDIRYKDTFLSFDIKLNDPTLSNFVPNSYTFSVGTTNPLSGYDSKGEFTYYCIRNYQGNIKINSVNLYNKTNIYYTIMAAGDDVVDENNNVIDGIYVCGSSGDIYPKEPAFITLYPDEELIFTGYKNENSINTKEKRPTNISKKKISFAKAPEDKIISGDDIPESEYLDNVHTPKKFSIRSAINVNASPWIEKYNINSQDPKNKLLPRLTRETFLPDNTKNYGQYLSNELILKGPGFTDVTFIDGSSYRHSGGSYIIKNNRYIPQNGEQSGLLLIIKNII